MSSLYYIAFWFGGRERNRTPPNWWIPLSILSNDIQTHGASTISDPVMPASNERFATPFSFSTYIISKLAANVKSLLIFFNNLRPAPPSLLVLSAYVGLWPAYVQLPLSWVSFWGRAWRRSVSVSALEIAPPLLPYSSVSASPSSGLDCVLS